MRGLSRSSLSRELSSCNLRSFRSAIDCFLLFASPPSRLAYAAGIFLGSIVLMKNGGIVVLQLSFGAAGVSARGLGKEGNTTAGLRGVLVFGSVKREKTSFRCGFASQELLLKATLSTRRRRLRWYRACGIGGSGIHSIRGLQIGLQLGRIHHLPLFG